MKRATHCEGDSSKISNYYPELCPELNRKFHCLSGSAVTNNGPRTRVVFRVSSFGFPSLLRSLCALLFNLHLRLLAKPATLATFETSD